MRIRTRKVKKKKKKKDNTIIILTRIEKKVKRNHQIIILRLICVVKCLANIVIILAAVQAIQKEHFVKTKIQMH